MRVKWTRRFLTICTAIVHAGDDSTLPEWLVDSAYRFFPAIPDKLFGYVLHPADIATNKALAAAGRREPRDIIDLQEIHQRYLPLGAVVWAACAKDPGLSPEGIIAEIRRNRRHQQADYDRLNIETLIRRRRHGEGAAGRARRSRCICAIHAGGHGRPVVSGRAWAARATRSGAAEKLYPSRRPGARPLAVIVGNQPRHAGTLWQPSA
jgi:hypothetical protein